MIQHGNQQHRALPARPFSRQQAQVAWENLRTSLWFVPAVLVVLAPLLAWLSRLADHRLSASAPGELPSLVYVSTPDNARDVMATLLASMVTMTSLVFSITIVVLTLAANQFGPRLVRNFMASPQTQFVLGTFVMTSVYCLAVLGGIGARASQEQQAFFSVSTGLGLVLASLCLLIMFLHFLGRSIVAETIIERVGRELDEVLDTLHPRDGKQAAPAAIVPPDLDARASRFGFKRAGYIEAIEFERLIDIAQAGKLVIRLSAAPGDYVVPGTMGIAVYPGSDCSPQVEHVIQGAVIIGRMRTPTQDPEFAIRHLVEIAVRALSPAINDPYTAIAVVNRLSASLIRLGELDLPDGQVRDRNGTVRVVCPGTSYAAIIGASFNQIRQSAAEKPIVLIHLSEAIARIAARAHTREQRDVLLQQLDAIAEIVAASTLVSLDKQAILGKAELARQAVRQGFVG
ncbi:MAG: hypothetical protein JWP99_1792 [Devosia sp.]|nr:hypothetical protein [Devosia sp.]